MAESQAQLVKDLVDAGVHFGHRVSRWNPKMEPYIHGKRNMIHIIDVKETIKGLLRAKRLIQNTIASGKDVLFVGTKHQARFAIEEEAKRCGMHYVSERWLGGTLTNFRTIRARLNRLAELEKLWQTGQSATYSHERKRTLQRRTQEPRGPATAVPPPHTPPDGPRRRRPAGTRRWRPRRRRAAGPRPGGAGPDWRTPRRRTRLRSLVVRRQWSVVSCPSQTCS